MTTIAPLRDRPAEGFRHEAMMYAGLDEFVAGLVPFLRDGIAAGEPTLVVVDRQKIERLRAELGEDAGQVIFADMAEVGSNPARIIPAWRDFVSQHAGERAIRGVGEPIYPSRDAAELVECQLHESLLNLAFADTPDFWLICPYDTTALSPDVIEEAQHSHPHVVEGELAWTSTRYRGLETIAEPFGAPLPEPPEDARGVAFESGGIDDVRGAVEYNSFNAGMSVDRIEDLVLAVSEIASNSIRHGGGAGELSIWRERDALICEVRDAGMINEPLAGRQLPELGRDGGWGLWLVNQLCDLVQIRSFESGTVVRLHMRVG
jgi:anti-sigma regulatory factor (Ser/Thr protein kinase)